MIWSRSQEMYRNSKSPKRRKEQTRHYDSASSAISPHPIEGTEMVEIWRRITLTGLGSVDLG
jgi:hypothetical protein